MCVRLGYYSQISFCQFLHNFNLRGGRGSICNENRPINPKVIYSHALYFLRTGVLLGYAYVNFQLSLSTQAAFEIEY